MGVPGPYNWRGSLFKNAMFTGTLGDFTYDMDWYQSAVEDQTLFNSVPPPVTNYYSYLGKALITRDVVSVLSVLVSRCFLERLGLVSSRLEG